jgi:lipooligosaccharide transport system ATP-binding protein
MAAPLEITNLTKRYSLRSGGFFEAVSGVSFQIQSGECLGLLGPNGAGKSTTIQCLSGFYPIDEGEVVLNGFNVHKNPREARKFLGICNQEETLDSDFNVIDQLVQHAGYFRIPRKQARLKAQFLLEKFELNDKETQPIESLSGGMRRRLQVVRALISDPSVLVLDEPTTGLDPEIRRMLWDALSDARKGGAAILLSTHYMEEAERNCDKVAIISKGKILDIDSPQNLIEKHIRKQIVREEIRPGVFWKRPPNLEDVYLKLTGSRLLPIQYM